MNRVMIALLLTVVAGCGVETATTAATSAAMKKQEIEAGKTTQAQMQKNLEQSMQQVEQRNQEAERR